MDLPSASGKKRGVEDAPLVGSARPRYPERVHRSGTARSTGSLTESGPHLEQNTICHIRNSWIYRTQENRCLRPRPTHSTPQDEKRSPLRNVLTLRSQKSKKNDGQSSKQKTSNTTLLPKSHIAGPFPLRFVKNFSLILHDLLHSCRPTEKLQFGILQLQR
jgi:hypothetical protein